MKEFLFKALFILLLVAANKSILHAQDLSETKGISDRVIRLGVKAELAGPSIYLVDRDYFRGSGEMEMCHARIPKYSISLEGGYFRTITRFDTVWGGVETGKALRIVSMQSYLVGFRRYFGQIDPRIPEGMFLELQSGYEQIRVDTSLNFLTFNPALNNFSNRSRVAFRLKGGFQAIFKNKLILSPCVSLNVWGLFRRDVWFRVVEPKIYLGILF